jgi:hypothetical protein
VFFALYLPPLRLSQQLQQTFDQQQFSRGQQQRSHSTEATMAPSKIRSPSARHRATTSGAACPAVYHQRPSSSSLTLCSTPALAHVSRPPPSGSLVPPTLTNANPSIAPKASLLNVSVGIIESPENWALPKEQSSRRNRHTCHHCESSHGRWSAGNPRVRPPFVTDTITH